MAAAGLSAILEGVSTRLDIPWISPDQPRFDTHGCNGDPRVTTPCADALVAGGVTCCNAFCQNPGCAPSRTGFPTGRYPRANGQALPEHEVLLPKNGPW